MSVPEVTKKSAFPCSRFIFFPMSYIFNNSVKLEFDCFQSMVESRKSLNWQSWLRRKLDVAISIRPDFSSLLQPSQACRYSNHTMIPASLRNNRVSCLSLRIMWLIKREVMATIGCQRNPVEAFPPDFPIVSSPHRAVGLELYSRYSIVYILTSALSRSTSHSLFPEL